MIATKKKTSFHILTKQLDYYVNSNIRESRDKNNNLNFLSGDAKLEEIKDYCSSRSV